MDKRIVLVKCTESALFSTYGNGRLLRNITAEEVKKAIASEGANVVVFIFPFYFDASTVKKAMCAAAPFQGEKVAVSRPSILCMHMFDREEIFYISVNISNKDDISTTDCGSVIKEASCTIEVDEIKKSTLRDGYSIVCYVETFFEGGIQELFCGKFEGGLDAIVASVYDILVEVPDREKLATSICIDSTSERVKTIFKDKFAMKMCTSEGDSLSRTTFLEVPRFVRDVRFVWKDVCRDPVLVGALKLVSTCDLGEVRAFTDKETIRTSGEDFFITK